MALGRREVLALAGIGAAAAAAGALVGALGRQSSNGAAALLAYPFEDLEGRPTRLRDWSARVLLCNFWATWCAPCRDEIPLLLAARRQHANKGVEIAGIGIDQVGKLKSFAKDFGVDYPILVAGADSGDLLRALGNNAAALPYSVVLDRERRVTYKKLGAWSKPELERELVAAIG
jgi:thiol-disulfide isomerase/thioredoxin